MKRTRSSILASLPIICLLPLLMANQDCVPDAPAESASGVSKANVKVATGSDGLTVEQRNVAKRLQADNKPGSLKHLYVISPFTGQVLIYSTVQGKVTSGSKRLTPKTVQTANNTGTLYGGFGVNINGNVQTTGEVLGDDGSYGESDAYLFWFDAAGRFHQQYASGCIIHISDQPLAVKNVTINMELKKEE